MIPALSEIKGGYETEMARKLLKNALLRFADAFGFELRRRDERPLLKGVLQHAKTMGLAPETVIDVGAAYGGFTATCATVFPEARYLLIEPLAEYVPSLRHICESLNRAEHIGVAAAARSGKVEINVHPDLVGSSLFLEDEDSDVNGVPRRIPVSTLDDVVRETGADPPFLIKVDVQGAELDVIEGAKSTLSETDYLVLEVSFLQFFKDAPLFHDVISYMQSMGFLVYDIFGLAHRPLDRALAQADVVFVRQDGSLRKDHHYATRTQREILNHRLRRSVTDPGSLQ